MKKTIILFLISLIYGFSVLIFRNIYEDKTGNVKSHWNTLQLEEGDSKNFFDRGMALYKGEKYDYGYENAPALAYFRTPVYSIFLAISFLIFGVSLKAVIVMQIIMASVIVCLTALITEIIFNNITSWISGFFAILYYPMWNIAVMINCELIAMLLGLISLYFVLKFYYSNGKVIKYLILSGLFISLAALARGQFFYYSFISLIFVFGISKISLKIKIKYSFVWFSFVLMPILLWTIYAYVTSGIFIFISSQGAMAIWWGWSPAVVVQQKYPMWNALWDNDKDVIKDDLHTIYLPVKSSFWFLTEAVKFIIAYPIDSIKIAYFKLLDAWGVISLYSEKSLFVKIFKALKYNWNFILTIPAWIIMCKTKKYRAIFIYTLWACIIYTLISLLTAGLIRYRTPFLDPLLVIVASYTVYKIYEYLKSKKLNL